MSFSFSQRFQATDYDLHTGGSVTLRSSNPFDPPVIELGLFTHPFDVEALRIGVSRAIRIFNAPAWSEYITALFTPDPDATPREIFDEAFIRDTGSSAYHATGTAAMSARDKSTEGVVDPDLKVKGVKGLRIVDASVIVSPLASSTFLHYPSSQTLASDSDWAYSSTSVHCC
jgi:choline dehydrogenase